MRKIKKNMMVAVAAGLIATGTSTIPAHGAQTDRADIDHDSATYTSKQTSSADAEVDQNSSMVVRPHKTNYYSGTNYSSVKQSGSASNTTVTVSDGDLSVDNTVEQEISNKAEVTQGKVKALPHSILYYDATNISYVDQYAETENTTATGTTGNLKLKKSVKQSASNSVQVVQGEVQALPHSTVYYEGVNESYVQQHAENTDTTLTESGGTLEYHETVEQETSNTAVVEQGEIRQWKHSTVYDNGENTSVIEQYENSTAG
ncbi:hypothetical protein [Kocuria rhizosphaericola]|uniref:hypothetical protein n=1 Tax=Kocuria rhizosphaericola TaxID=3376284 RepID=UPI00379200EC